MALTLGMLAPSALASIEGYSIASLQTKGASCIELLRSPDRQQVRRDFIANYADKTYTSEAQNQAWIESSLRNAQYERFYVVMENAELKRLNDEILKDKDLVTALTHFQKEVFLEQIQKDFPELQIKVYSDFKSVRLEVLSPIDTSMFARFKMSFDTANRSFYRNPPVREILRNTDLNQAPLWFALGVGETADQASLAARGARLKASRGQLFSESGFQYLMRQKIEIIQANYQELITELSETSLVENDKLKLQVYVLARKASTSEKLLAELRIEFGNVLSIDTANKIKELTMLADEFSPSMLIAKRETLTLHEAPFGAITLDFIGLGGENLKATTEALLSANGLRSALELTRTSEREVTELFILKKQNVSNVVKDYFNNRVSIKFSGDDGVIIPQREFWLRDQLALMRQLAALSPDPYFRMTTLHQRASQAEDSAQFITHAESIEKLLRPLIRQHMGSEINRQVSINAFISGDDQNRDVHLVLNSGLDFKRSEKDMLVKLFHQAVRDFEHQLRLQGEEMSYEAVEAYAITPSTPRAD